MLLHRRHQLGALIFCSVVSCGSFKEETFPNKTGRVDRAERLGSESKFPKITLADVEDLDVIEYGPAEGKPYPDIGVKFGKPIAKGKWLGLANGDGQFLAERHLIVNRFKQKPDWLGEGDLDSTIVVNVDTGETVAEFEFARYEEWKFGLLIGFIKDDKRPYLFDSKSETVTLAMPHIQSQPYTFGENYHLCLSHSQPIV